MKKHIIQTLLFASAIALGASASADILAQYNFTGSNDNSSDSDANSTATPLSIGLAGTEFGDIGTSNGWSTSSLNNDPEASALPPVRYIRDQVTANSEAAAISANDFFKFTLTPDGGSKADLSSLFFDIAVNTPSFPSTANANFFLQSSVDAYTANIGATATVTATTTNNSVTSNYSRFTIDLSGSPFQNLTTATTFRLYIYDSSDNGAVNRLDNLTLNGSVSVIPELSTFAMLFGSMAMQVVFWRRRTRA